MGIEGIDTDAISSVLDGIEQGSSAFGSVLDIIDTEPGTPEGNRVNTPRGPNTNVSVEGIGESLGRLGQKDPISLSTGLGTNRTGVINPAGDILRFNPGGDPDVLGRLGDLPGQTDLVEAGGNVLQGFKQVDIGTSSFLLDTKGNVFLSPKSGGKKRARRKQKPQRVFGRQATILSNDVGDPNLDKRVLRSRG